MYSGQIEIAEMHISVGYGLQPTTQVGGLRITRHKEQAVGANRPFKQRSLLAYPTEILHSLYSYHNDILRNGKRLPISNKQEAPFRWIYYRFTPIQPAGNLFVGVDGETRA